MYSDYMSFDYYVLELRLTTRDTITKALRRMSIDRCSSLSNVFLLAQAEGQSIPRTYCSSQKRLLQCQGIENP